MGAEEVGTDGALLAVRVKSLWVGSPSGGGGADAMVSNIVGNCNGNVIEAGTNDDDGGRGVAILL